jgi:uncharacterized cupredoxin-like copper-binding protein
MKVCSRLGLAALAVVAAVAAAPAAGARSHAATSVTVTVKMTEFKFVLSRKTVPHGLVIFKVVNNGALKHDFKIHLKKTPILAPHGKATLKVRFAKGRFPYKCTVDSHAKFGMKGVLKVT